jgi:peptide-methionine (S)-S-oxide reductase
MILKPAHLVMIAAVAAVVAVLPRVPGTDAVGEAPFAGPTERAVFAGGCFWGLQAAFDELPGVVATRAGYTGGTVENPTYSLVVAGETGHAEAVEVVFDPARVGYSDLVRHFFRHYRVPGEITDARYQVRPYRSAIFVSDAVQREIAQQIRTEFAEQHRGGGTVGTLIEDAGPFWEAEAEHQHYLARCAH